jgi:hypothetical protein
MTIDEIARKEIDLHMPYFPRMMSLYARKPTPNNEYFVGVYLNLMKQNRPQYCFNYYNHIYEGIKEVNSDVRNSNM